MTESNGTSRPSLQIVLIASGWVNLLVGMIGGLTLLFIYYGINAAAALFISSHLSGPPKSKSAVPGVSVQTA